MTQKQKKRPVCLVIQDFENATYVRRYNESIKPALERARVDAQRSDVVFGQNPNIQKIQTGLLDVTFCMVEVSENIPLVWFTLGCALSYSQYVIVLCDKSRILNLPIDFKNFPTIFYRSDSISGFRQLELDITKKVNGEINNLLIDRNKISKEIDYANSSDDDVPF